MKNKKFISIFMAITLFMTSFTISFAENDFNEYTEIGESNKIDESTETSESDIDQTDGTSSSNDNTIETDKSLDFDSFCKNANPFAFTQPKLERLQGNNYETAAKIADKQNYNSVILVNLDNNIADGLSASGLSGATNSPILLTQTNTIPDVTMQRISSKVNKVYIIGGTNSISQNVENKIKSAGKTVIRIQGSDRIDTSIKVANEIQKNVNSKYVFLVNGFNGEADAISISPVSSIYKSPIILTDGNKTNYTTSNKECYVIGGPNNMSNTIVSNTNATRISGNDRFETNEEVVNAFIDTESYCSLIENENLSFNIVDGYNLSGGLLASTISKDALFCLVSPSSDKGYMYIANKIVAFGSLDESIINNCLNPYPVYNEMFGMWTSESNEDKELNVDPDFLMTFIGGEPENINYENSLYKIKKINASEKSVIIEETTGSIKKYTKLTNINSTRLKLETSSDMINWKNVEYFISVFSEEGQMLQYDSEMDFQRNKAKRIIRICKTKTLGVSFDVILTGICWKYGFNSVKSYITKKGVQASRRIFTKTLASRLVAKGAGPLAGAMTAAVNFALGYASVGGAAAKWLDSIDPRPSNGYIEVGR
ncbi:cell wall-binding repeat-containing protein [Clostridioides mangenotii]|uniref:cell wall-binding repeat-containing protein n=1 Tax=Metaclostridioides mangenotii TaxID=1540 RepID=UPI002149EE06|nr:cell wall-binding repeat-containing protein [Clostridioides mangenotii]MCR1954112.1 cell wall-binding repeat-containing protein [Clostridioides mangenotii]